ncbi:MAG: hypothetical protein M1828_004537 [Chrysothrix sp. TS-e1954]|nr:MAG: hypothetical protein M1828_004537 [Chrysothrix sp. TS-e1954]
MFYSHEILTSRKYGIATVWLVATLGSRNHLKKIGRKTILEVNVPKACDTITTPEAPMALRLQSNRLYGVARVYSQQCEYVLVDAQGMQTTMRHMLKVVQSTQLDMETGRATRPEQLLLQDDPAFVPDMAFGPLDLDFSNLDLATDLSSQGDSILSPHSRPSSRSSLVSLPGLVIPSSHSGGGGFAGTGVPDDGDITMSGMDPAGYDDFALGDLLPDAGFTFDTQGNMYDIDTSGEEPLIPVGRERLPARSETSLQDQVRREHEEARLAGAQAIATVGDNDIEGFPPPDDQSGNLGLPSSAQQPPPDHAGAPAVPSSEYHQGELPVSEETSHESRSAPLARRSQRKPIPKDTVTELRNSDLISWNQNYIANMEEAKKHKTALRETALAKHNAQHWLWGTGLGGIGSGIGSFGLSTPFDAYYGQGLHDLLIGASDSASLKRDGERSSEDGADSEDRRVRPRSDAAYEIGRGDEATFLGDDGGFGPGGDDQVRKSPRVHITKIFLTRRQELEIGRQAPTPAPGDISHDVSSIMPWNISAGSRSRVGSLSSRQAVQQPQRRGSRIVSASPLLGRGSAVLPISRAGSVGSGVRPPSAQAGVAATSADDAGIDDGFALLPPGSDDHIGPPTLDRDFERYGPAAEVDTQTAAASQWVRERLDIESNNFLEFVETAATERQTAAIARGEAVSGPRIAFEDLLPPASNSRIVAAQGLLHVLVLATRGVLAAEQSGPFEAITLTV